ncbi:MAG TPA: DinB family protein [Candidatus Eisenbacteria bacterium]
MARGRPLDVENELLEAFRHSGRVSEHLIAILPPALWRAEPPSGRGRSIAAIVAHMQGVRRMFARMGGARPDPPSLDRRTVTMPQARKAIHQSTEQLAGLFEAALRARQARVKGMPRRVVDMLTYIVQHDAHHRGQICTLARDLGHRFESGDMTRIWGWTALPPAP